MTQTAISARIDNEILWALDQYCMAHPIKRNRILNEALQLWLDLQQRRHDYRHHYDSEAHSKIFAGFCDLWFPEFLLYPGEIHLKSKCGTRP